MSKLEDIYTKQVLKLISQVEEEYTQGGVGQWEAIHENIPRVSSNGKPQTSIFAAYCPFAFGVLTLLSVSSLCFWFRPVTVTPLNVICLFI
jgi:hypothetical protein